MRGQGSPAAVLIIRRMHTDLSGRTHANQPSLALSDLESVEKLCWGLTFFGTGGGGRIEAGRNMLAPVVTSGGYIMFLSLAELPGDAWIGWAIIVGGKDPDEPPPWEELKQYGLAREEYPMTVLRLGTAVRELEAYTGKAIDALVSLELSSAATGATIMTARELIMRRRRGLI